MLLKNSHFNMDTGCVEGILSDGSLLSIDCTALENSIDTTIAMRSELDWLIYNAPNEYAELVLNGDLDSSCFYCCKSLIY